MRFENEKDMPIFEIENEDGTVKHLSCNGSRRHVLHWNSNGVYCSESRCEINHNGIFNKNKEEGNEYR